MLQVNHERVAKLLQGLAAFTDSEEGVTRLAYSPLDKKAQSWLLEQVQDLHLQIRTDAVGNVFLRRDGKQPQLPPVASGSHLDTVIHGGAYDGMCGVVGALEALYMLQDEELERSIEVIIFRAEESSRFGFATMGSKLLTGSAAPEQLNKGAKKGDISFIEALREWGCDPDAYRDAVIAPGSYKCFAELHIEQGKVLEQTQHQLGIVQNIAAPTRFKIHIKGVADHSGATPMGMRRDALVSAAKLILAVNEAAETEKANGSVGTVGVVDVEPGSINVVPGAVTLWVDVRGVDEASIERVLQSIREQAENVAVCDGVGVQIEMLTADSPVALDKALAAQSEAICTEKGFSFLHMNSGAGHDAMHMTKICPTTMLFIPCRAGISHNPAEYASTEDICRGIEVLAIPGCCASISALSVSGFDTREFAFYGFLPREKKDLREKLLQMAHQVPIAAVHESPFRVVELVEVVCDTLPGCRISASCDLTKLHEKTIRGDAADVRPCTVSGIIADTVREKSAGIASAWESLKSYISASTGRLASDQWFHWKPHTGMESGSTNSQCRNCTDGSSSSI